MATGAERKRIPAAERRALIVRAAGRAFARDGYGGTCIEDIAAAAHVTKPIVYRHFHSKKALYMAVLERHEADLPTFIAAVDPDGLSPGELARAILELWFDYVRENQHAWYMLFRDRSGDEEIQALRLRVNVRARAVIAAFLVEYADRRLPADQIEPTAEALTNALAGLALWWIDHPDVPKDVPVDVGTRIVTTAL